MRARRVAASAVLVAPAAAFLAASAQAGVSPRDYQRLIEQLSDTTESRKRASQQLIAYDVVFRRDPMRPVVDAQGGLLSPAALHDGLSVQGIIWSEAHPLAVIEGDIFSVGERVGPYTILEIKPSGVVAQRGNEMLFIPLDRGVGAVQPVTAVPSATAVAPAAAPNASPAPTIVPLTGPAPAISTAAATPAADPLVPLAPPAPAPSAMPASSMTPATSAASAGATVSASATASPPGSAVPPSPLPMKLDARPIPSLDDPSGDDLLP
jgi:hypothetical protein